MLAPGQHSQCVHRISEGVRNAGLLDSVSRRVLYPRSGLKILIDAQYIAVAILYSFLFLEESSPVEELDLRPQFSQSLPCQSWSSRVYHELHLRVAHYLD